MEYEKRRVITMSWKNIIKSTEWEQALQRSKQKWLGRETYLNAIEEEANRILTEKYDMTVDWEGKDTRSEFNSVKSRLVDELNRNMVAELKFTLDRPNWDGNWKTL